MSKIHFFYYVLLLLFVSCGKDSKPVQQKYITIGGIFPLTGEFCSEGIRALKGLQMARHVINEHGGVFGMPLDIIVLDDKNDTLHAIEQYRILKEKGVVAIIGSSFPEITQVLAREAEKDGMPIISPISVNPAKSKILADFARNALGAKTALILDDHKYDSTTRLFEKEFKLGGGTILGLEDYSTPEDFKGILAKYKSNQPDIIFCQTNYIVAAKLVEAAHNIGLDKPNFIGTYAWEGILGFLRESWAMERIYYATPFMLDEDDPQVHEFAQHFFSNFSQMPLSASALSYSAVQILVAAIESSQSLEPEDIIMAIKTDSPDVVTKHKPLTVYIMQIKDNFYSVVEKIKL